MKLSAGIFSALILVVSLSAEANTSGSVFGRSSPVPAALRERILSAVQARCPSIITPYGLEEIKTEVREDHVDQGVVDFFYSTSLSSRYFADGMHPATTTIQVESAEYAFSNGDNLQILGISSGEDCR
jgi:hypothetical protein